MQHIIKIIDIEYLNQKSILLTFSDGKRRNFNLEAYLNTHQGSLLNPLNDAAYARRLFIDAGALCWPNGLALSPERLYELRS